MTQVPVSRLHPFIAPSVSACPDPTIDHHVIVAARELCRRSLAWRVTDTVQTTGADVETITVPADASLIALESANFDGRPLESVAYPESLCVSGDTPVAITQVGMDSISLVPPGVGQLTISMHLMPSTGASTLPEFLVDQYAAEIATGALAGLFMIPGANWSNLELGEATRLRFNATLDRLFAAHMKGQQRAPLRTRYSSF